MTILIEEPVMLVDEASTQEVPSDVSQPSPMPQPNAPRRSNHGESEITAQTLKKMLTSSIVDFGGSQDKHLHLAYSFLSTLLLALLSLSKVSFSQDCSDQTQDSETIIVDQSGEGQFTTVQEAIDSVPAKNSIWTHILVKPGIYKEKVVIPANKPCIVLEGNSASDTMIEWGDGGEVDESATFTLSAENFKAKNIGFKNLGKQENMQGCKINATTDILDGLPGYITAQGRNSATGDTGYIFKECSVEGTGTVYLGRAYKQYSRVVFYKSDLSSVVVPKGWNSWRYAGEEGSITFVENKCTGAGADRSERIKWEKTLSSEELDKLTDANTFINQDGTIVVDQSGHGQFTTVQQAIDSIPAKNNVWTRILVKPGIYKEKVVIPADKPCIVLQGRTASDTVIEWGDGGEVNKTATFTLYAENFKAKNIRFENTYNLKTPHGDRNSIRQAPAFQITSDKVSFYQCAFIGVQDTLTDFQGRHYFESCYIEGAVDFIWGNGQSIYKGCTINASTAILGGFTGYITAQGRDSATDTTGYIFEQCSVVGTGPVYLGRAYRQYSRVVFHKTHLSSVVVPKGWDPWTYVGRE
ncbi:probable pectinesterase 55 [Eucalyptus grandis]|uniref:probable pectinesterase 55 n=1 Tax=Eucalyptus grandis TaxID=71139 RepID=UPI00192EEC12|nr:probable pectinesterase 55 [Eucalyptus grandis]